MADAPVSQRDIQQAEVVSEHLPSGYTAAFDGSLEESSSNPSSAAVEPPQDDQQSSLKLQGGDIHRALYKIDHRARGMKRAATFAHPSPRLSLYGDSDDISISEQLNMPGLLNVPGGFRRQFVHQKHKRFNSSDIPITRNFVEFLDLYGSFAGEDLAESEDESLESEQTREDERAETRPLLPRRPRRSSRGARKGDAGTTKTFFTLLKAFIGTGIMFLPKAFNNGGILFSSMTLVIVSLLTSAAFHLLLECRKQYGGGYGELGEAIGGTKMRAVILGSITISQLGFVCSGIVFVAENLLSFLDAVVQGSNPISAKVLIAIQIVVLIPLAFIRNISKLGPAALLADVCILLGLAYIYYYDIAAIAKNGIHPTVQFFNPDWYTLTIGAAIFTFEGIGLILPIHSSMRKPEKFELLLYLVMLIITVIFTSVGVFCYATFGSETKIEIISNYPQNNKLVNAVQFLYSLAVLVGTPVQLFPAMRILEGKIFGHRSGKRDRLMKWKKNAFRTAIVIVCGMIAILGSSNLDRFVALIGSFACVPLVYIYPPLLHCKGVARSSLMKAIDILFAVVGLVAMVYTTCITVVNSILQ